jgi:predicted nucleotidyltransferase/DNA-binding transcriptional ArsR family regulator
MDMSAPYLVALPKGEGPVLSVLAGTTRPLSGREVARLSGGSLNTVRRALQRLAEHGLVRMQEAGSGAALLYTLNREHLAADAVIILVNLRRRLIDHLKAELQDWPLPPMHASLFGSAARGDGGTASDIDVFIVSPGTTDAEDERWRRQLDRLAALILNWTGNHAGIAEVSEDDIERLEEQRPPVAKELERDAITLIGPPIRELLRRTSK